ncbi:unnamed protein product [Withania somnifera]
MNNEISFIHDTFCCDGFEDTLAKINLTLNSKLNPLAKQWDPSLKAPKVDRTLFMMFSRGTYFSKREVTDFFQRMCGEDSVHGVYLYKKPGANIPYGKIVLKNISICAWVMKGRGHHKEAKYYIGSGHVYLRKYNPLL